MNIPGILLLFEDCAFHDTAKKPNKILIFNDISIENSVKIGALQDMILYLVTHVLTDGLVFCIIFCLLPE